MRFDDGIFGLYAQSYENRREVEYSLEDYLRACSDDAAFYAGPAERLLKAIGEPDHQGLPGLRRRFLRHGRHDRADRRVLPPCRAGPRGAQAGALSARPGWRRQILPRRAVEAADGEGAGL